MSVVDWLSFEAELFANDPREWLLLTGDRLLVSALGLGALAATFAVIVPTGLVPLEKETPTLFLLFALIAANFTLIAIVTSLSQFVLGRRLESPGEIRATLDDTVDYRQEVADTIGRGVLPVAPDAFFRFLFESVGATADRLARVSDEGRTRRAREEIDDLSAGLRSHVDYVATLLDRPESGMKHALFAALNTEYEVYVHRAWHLRTEHGDELTDRAAEPLDRLTDILEHAVVAARMFKTTFIESEVAELSRFLLYVGLPAQIAAVVTILLYTAPGQAPPVSRPTLVVLVPAVVTAGFAPFLVLAAYVIRLTVVARRTANQFPFSSRLEGGAGLGASARGRDRDRDPPRDARSGPPGESAADD